MQFLKEKIWTALALMLACVGMWGCGDSDYREWGGRYGGILVSIINDSLALLTNSRGYEDCHEVFMGSADCEHGGTNDGLFLVNYRKKQLPYWGDTTNGHLFLIDGFYRDSVALFSNDREEFGFWKIGGHPRVVKKWNCGAPCDCDDGMYQKKSARPWVDGKVLLKMEWKDECPYAILDTATGVVNKLDFIGEYAWLDGCDDITYIDGEVVCLKRLDDAMGAISLLTSAGVVDSFENTKERDFLGYPPVLYGDFMLVKAYRKDVLLTRLVAKVGKSGFDSSYPETRIEVNDFVDSTGVSIGYSSEDLIVTK